MFELFLKLIKETFLSPVLSGVTSLAGNTFTIFGFGIDSPFFFCCVVRDFTGWKMKTLNTLNTREKRINFFLRLVEIGLIGTLGPIS